MNRLVYFAIPLIINVIFNEKKHSLSKHWITGL